MALRSAAGAPKTLRGFEAVSRYWDSADGHWVAQVLPGEYYVTTHAEVIATVLGSCVSTCIRDPFARVGGMNHFMLPHDQRSTPAEDALRYGCFALERLINELLKHGARRERLEIKAFGGGKVIRGMGDIGKSNIAFVRSYFETELLDIISEDLGGNWARRVRYYPEDGRVLIKRLDTREHEAVAEEEVRFNQRLSVRPVVGEVELFT